jgi:hypothetical protein
MDFDFIPKENALYIPQEAYQPAKKCPFCHSLFLTDTNCETCGRSLNYELIGKPFSYKSYYILKEKYLESFSLTEKLIPSLENKNSNQAQSYKRKIVKRLKDLLIGFNTPKLMGAEERKLFYIEALAIIDELINYNFSHNELEKLIFEQSTEENSFQGLQLHLKNAAFQNTHQVHWIYTYKVWGVLHLSFIIKSSLILAAVLLAALKFKTFFN